MAAASSASTATAAAKNAALRTKVPEFFDAVTVFASGARRQGLEAVMAALASHFRGREGVWIWTERYRVVDGCRSAFILYETVYELPSIGYRQRAMTGVLLVRRVLSTWGSAARRRR